MTPIVLMPTADMVSTVMAGLARAGASPDVAAVTNEATLAELLAPGDSVDAAVLWNGSFPDLPHAVERLLARGARPVPALEAARGIGVLPSSIVALTALPAGLNVPVPSLQEDDARALVWSCLREARLEEHHHLVEVDGGPAIEELRAKGTPPGGDLFGLLAAGAAGVLAGRMVAGNRRWGRQLDR